MVLLHNSGFSRCDCLASMKENRALVFYQPTLFLSLLKLCPKKLGHVLAEAIDAVNDGSMKSIDRLVTN